MQGIVVPKKYIDTSGRIKMKDYEALIYKFIIQTHTFLNPVELFSATIFDFQYNE